MGADLGLKARQLPFRDIGGIAENGVQSPRNPEGLQEVPCNAAHAARDAMAGGVGGGEAQRRFGDIDRNDPHLGSEDSGGDGNATGPRAHIGDQLQRPAGLPLPSAEREQLLDEKLCLGARDQHSPVHLKLQRAELLNTGDVLDRNPTLAPQRQQMPIPLQHLRFDIVLEAGGKHVATRLESEGEEDFGVEPRRGDAESSEESLPLADRSGDCRIQKASPKSPTSALKPWSLP